MWTAVILGTAVAVLLAAYGACAALAVAHGASPWPFVVGLPLAYLAFPLLFTALWVTLGWWLRAPPPTGITLTLRQQMHLFVGEFASIALSVPKMILYRMLMRDPPPAPAELPVLLLHGVGCNAGVWTGLSGYLDSRGLGPVYALSYGPPLASIEHFADLVASKIVQIRTATGARDVLLVAHSMGGLVARAYLRRYGGSQVRRLVTIGTPHHGSMHAWLMFGQALAQMRPHSAFLEQLNVDNQRAAGVPVVSLWSWHDSMVTPQTSARLDWAENVVITGVAHNAMLNDERVYALVVDEIRKARAENVRRVDAPCASTVQ
ncbi:MAG: alpha/beta fold hydrolase [Burkholderiales bacterium]|nr:alpha/beta fold hydrolase [Burkholderiales bacterium]